jgi:hypothetical protein
MSRSGLSATVKAMDITASTLDGVIDAARQLAGSRPATSDVQALVRRVSLVPSVRVELRAADATIYSGAHEVLVARAGLASGVLTVFVVADLARAVLGSEPLARATRDGVRLEVHDADSLEAGERLIRWRIGLERFGPQWRAASP